MTIATTAQFAPIVVAVDEPSAVPFYRAACGHLDAPLRCPHHTVSREALIGELALAAGGVLYLTDAQLYTPGTLVRLVNVMVGMHAKARPLLVLDFSAHLGTRVAELYLEAFKGSFLDPAAVQEITRAVVPHTDAAPEQKT